MSHCRVSAHVFRKKHHSKLLCAERPGWQCHIKAATRESTRVPLEQSIAKASETGPATVLIAGLAVGMFSTVPPVLFLVVAIVISLALSGIYGVALAAVRLT